MTDESEALQPLEFAVVARGREFLYGLLKSYFMTLPDAAMVRESRSAGFDTVLNTIIGDEDMNRDIVAGAVLMRTFLANTMETEPSKVAEMLGVDRTRLYRGVSPGYGPKPPYEIEWRGGLSRGTGVLQEIARVYARSGLALSEETRERLDYVGVELDYMQQLAGREATAWEAGQVDAARDALRMQDEFVREHLGAWAPEFVEEARKQAATDLYSGHLLMLRGFLAEEAERLPYLVEPAWPDPRTPSRTSPPAPGPRCHRTSGRGNRAPLRASRSRAHVGGHRVIFGRRLKPRLPSQPSPTPRTQRATCRPWRLAQ